MGPRWGAVFIAWANLEDLYDTGKTPIPEAHAALRHAAVEWLERPSDSAKASYIEKWAERANRNAQAIVARDGGFWSSPS